MSEPNPLAPVIEMLTPPPEPPPEPEKTYIDTSQSILQNLWTADSNTQISPYTKSLIYGDAGSGKTLLGAQAPKPLILDVENSTEVLDDWPEIKDQCKILPLRTFDEMTQAYWLIQHKHEVRELEDRETVVLDTISEFGGLNLDGILRQKEGEAQYLPHQIDYKKNGEMLRRFLTLFRDLDMHVLILCHKKEIKNEITGALTIRPDLPGKAADTVKRIVGLQAFLAYNVEFNEQGEEVFTNWLWSKQTRNIEAKSRYRWLPAMVQNPTYQDVINAKLKSIELGEADE